MSASTYMWVKAWHVIAVIAWYAGLFYIFRLFVYHVQKREQPDVVATLTVMERRLLKAIMLPAAVISLALGATMLVMQPVLLSAPWMWAKLGAVVVLLGYHALSAWVYARFARGDYVLTETQCRFLNEVPTLLLFVIVIAVIVRP